ncbi:coiled-coil domain-containing protein 112-like [Orbicella faveolata]|uniref:coiled-coil domain-containing protein 112-like n=1 Tax=Orbicella faveolata TaxID=48498 RepID=UPI0009E2F555|nr:coiled-coil domain-containing protein 112-like [Orbicella faveolata]
MLDDKQAKKKVKEVEKMEKEKRLQKLKSQVEVNVSRDPSRLYKLTAGWEQRKKDGPGASGSGPTLHMPHRYVCTSSVVNLWYILLLAIFPFVT